MNDQTISEKELLNNQVDTLDAAVQEQVRFIGAYRDEIVEQQLIYERLVRRNNDLITKAEDKIVSLVNRRIKLEERLKAL